MSYIRVSQKEKEYIKGRIEIYYQVMRKMEEETFLNKELAEMTGLSVAIIQNKAWNKSSKPSKYDELIKRETKKRKQYKRKLSKYGPAKVAKELDLKRATVKRYYKLHKEGKF